jgi:ABC-type spermidine/putrescine transport system permease subunit II
LLRWYEDFFTSPRWLPALMNSLLVASVTTLITNSRGRWRRSAWCESNFG